MNVFEKRMAKYFEALDVWRDARSLAHAVYDVTAGAGFAKDFGLCDQIRRAAVSVMSNIAEGFERGGNQEFLQFLSIAKGSGGEVRSQLYVAKDQGYLSEERFHDLHAACRRPSIMISSLIDSLKGSGMKGVKFKKPTHRTMKEEVESLMRDLDPDLNV